MTDRKSRSHLSADREKPRPVAADSAGDNPESEPLGVRFGDLWGDLIRVTDEARDLDASRRAASFRGADSASRSAHAIPILDDMKGILQWD